MNIDQPRNPNSKRCDCRIDCIKGCTVVEIKPEGAKDLGEKQAVAYREGLRAMYAERGEGMFVGGFEKLRACVSSDRKELQLNTYVDRYPFCPETSQLAPELPRVSPDIPADAN